MKIANFSEYIAILREIYSQNAMGELGDYYRALMQSGAELRKKKAALQKQIYLLNMEIKKQAALIRKTADKKTAGLEMAQLQKKKAEQINLFKQLQNSDHFNALSEEAKASVCSGFLLQKFLARELLENNPLHFPLDANGDLVINPSELRSSNIIQEAGHIRDFVATYLGQYPNKVKTPGHFKTMLNGVKNWSGLLAYVDNYFENLNDSDYLEEGPIKASRQGAEVIQVFAEQGLQLVRLHTEKALDYESEKMEHCVGKGGYDKGIKSGKTYIYSLRDCGEQGEWLPHATIEYCEGKIKQVKGVQNKAVAREFLPLVRDCIKQIMKTDDLDKLNQEGKLADLKNWGYLADGQKRLICVYENEGDISLQSVNQDDWFLELIEPERIKTEKFVISKGMTEEALSFIQRFKQIDGYQYDVREVRDWRNERRLLKKLFGVDSNEALLPYVKNPEVLGFVPAFSGQRGITIVFGDYKPPEKVDLLNPGNMAVIGDLSLTTEQLEIVDTAHLCCQKLEIKGDVKQKDLDKMVEFAGYQDIHFNDTNFESLEKLDLSALTHWGKPLMLDGNALLDVYSFFQEGYTVSRHLPGMDIVFRNCRNILPLDKIKYPAEIQNIMIEPADGEVYCCKQLDFSHYPKLEALQLNQLSLAEGARINLPESLVYLGIYKSNLKSLKKLDLSHLSQLKELRLSECNLEGIEQFIFPASLEKTAFGGASFKPGVDLDLSNCAEMKHFDLSSWSKRPLSCESLCFPEGIEDIVMGRLECPELKELDFSVYPNLKRLHLDQSAFPKLEKLVLPKQCETKIDGICTNAEITVVERKISPQRNKKLDKAVLLRFPRAKIVDAR